MNGFTLRQGTVLLHVWGQEVVLVDANLNIVLHCCFIDGNGLLDSCLKRNTTYESSINPVYSWNNIELLPSEKDHSNLKHLQVLFTTADGHFGLKKLIETLILNSRAKDTLKRFAVNKIKNSLHNAFDLNNMQAYVQHTDMYAGLCN